MGHPASLWLGWIRWLLGWMRWLMRFRVSRVQAEDGGVGWEEGEDFGDGFSEAVEGGSLVGCMDEARGSIAVIGRVAAEEHFRGFVEFEEFVLGYAGVEPGDPREGGGGGAARKG